ncbi:TIGR04283 family arsenosugar biosynthesis glycosyltransferase [Sulfurospirillum arcachonense]|uniref:TIGR04283 family arsenosugar biosynthesis glycosyltransferase n=1 Tax=Sulfurospirillum arcachonense TaxID=57666 RepID=UPI0004689AD3|nr:TIGR04283 family arsenosugar biosynthesis glycosyltransferase [Sulfurospirillum arcachonense]
MALKQALIYFAKEPTKGKVKTRLAKSIGEVEAKKIYELMLGHLLGLHVKENIDTFVALLPFTQEFEKAFQNQDIFLQEGENIGQKMANAFEKVFALGYESAVLVGADIPSLDENILHEAFTKLQTHETILSPTRDDGYYLIGFQKNSFTKNAFTIDFSNDVYTQTKKALKHLNVYEGKKLFDIDYVEDLRTLLYHSKENTNKKLCLHVKTLLDSFPKISVIIPVYYEKQNLPITIKHLKDMAKNSSFEIIVCDTPQNTTIGDIKDSSILTCKAKKAGRAYQLNEAASRAKGEILLFLHADTHLPKHWDELLCLHIESGTVAGAFKLGIFSNHFFLKLIEILANLRVFFTNTPYGDQAQFFTSNLFQTIKGYDEIALMEDIAIIKKVHKKNIKVKILNEKVYTSDRRWLKEGIFYTSFRNRILSTLYFFGVSPKILKKFYK